MFNGVYDAGDAAVAEDLYIYPQGDGVIKTDGHRASRVR
jgi:acyl-coenzyme A synthetase/AMP-(fatty) acid ligase